MSYPATAEKVSRTNERRFSGDGPSGFSPLEFTRRVDELSGTYWNGPRLLSTHVTLSIGYIHPLDDSILDWYRERHTRKDAAKQILAAYRRGLKVEKTAAGFAISPVVNRAWRQA